MATEKETTAPIPSVAPDGEQPSALARTNSITDIEEPHKRFGKIQAMTMPELMETRFPLRPAVIEGLLPAGTYLLAGAPKIGKSWLALWLCLCVSQGQALWNFATTQGEALYLSLEDSFQRIQTRRKLHKAHIQLLHAPPDLFRMARDGICERAEDVKLHAGFLQQPHAFQHAPVRAAA